MSTDRYGFQLARSPLEIKGYYNLRQVIFCQEQGLFSGSDRDETDEIAYPIIAIDREAPEGQNIVGVVRIYETEPRLWYGGRLGVHSDYRGVGGIGQGLIYKAVTTAQGWGCDRFLASVQLQNVRFFKRQHWHSLEKITVCDRPHHLMAADLDFYPPMSESMYPKAM